MALGVDNEWCKKFDSILKQVNYSPQWYGGGGDLSVKDLFDKELAVRLKELSKSFKMKVNCAQIAPTIIYSKESDDFSRSSRSRGSSDWDSGSRGSGRSGGGGGGGGGRGW
jgi:uncharacterized membrane protein YgcG